MKEYEIPVEWQMCGYIKIKAESLEKAVQYFCENKDKLDLPTDSNCIDGSFQIPAKFWIHNI